MAHIYSCDKKHKRQSPKPKPSLLSAVAALVYGEIGNVFQFRRINNELEMISTISPSTVPAAASSAFRAAINCGRGRRDEGSKLLTD